MKDIDIGEETYRKLEKLKEEKDVESIDKLLNRIANQKLNNP
ncbi:MAG: hypothetical protein ABEK16_02815 [Candidatus Nanohalobium sp.]